jgi:hypothetical protein
MIGHTDIALHWSINFSLYISGKIWDFAKIQFYEYYPSCLKYGITNDSLNV